VEILILFVGPHNAVNYGSADPVLDRLLLVSGGGDEELVCAD
jgi:hypothetical protein